MYKTTLLLFATLSFLFSSGQNWIQRHGSDVTPRVNPVSFTIAGKAYIAIGSSQISHSSTKFNDLWEYDTLTNVLTQKANVPGAGRSGGIGASNSGFGYVGLGWDGSVYFKGIQKYDPANDSWSLETIYPGSASRNSFAAVNNGNLYVGGGSNSNGTMSDFWKYNFSTGLWSQLPSMPLGARQSGIKFSIDSIVFFGMGHNGTINHNDIWGYNVNSGLWTQYSNFPGIGRISSSVNVVGKKVMVGGGHPAGLSGTLSDYYEFDYTTNSWTTIGSFNAISRSLTTSFTLGDRAFIYSGKDSLNNPLNDLWEYNGQNWVQKLGSSLPARVNPVSFTIAGKAYVAIGSSQDTPSSTKFSDLWEYDTLNNLWTQKANVPGVARTGGIGFSNSGFGYVGMGWDGTSVLKDIQKYDVTNDSWTLETTYPGTGARNCFAAVNNGDLYVGGGSNLNGLVSDFWKYNFTTGLWSQLPTIPLGARQAGISFSIDSIVFFGMGYTGTVNQNDIWGYNVNSGLWTQYSNFPGIGRIQSSVNVIGKKVIVGGGHPVGIGGSLSDYYEFDYTTNSWTSIVSFIAGSRSTSTGFTIGRRTFLSLGKDSLGNALGDLWEYAGVLTSIQEEPNNIDFSIHPNPSQDYIVLKTVQWQNVMLKIFNAKGAIVLEANNHKPNQRLDISHLQKGIYNIVIVQNNKILKSSPFIKNE